jgi:hypothetical protein
MTETATLPKIDIGLLYAKEGEFEEIILNLFRLKDDVGLKQIGFIGEEEICSKWEDSKEKGIAEVRDILNKHVRVALDKLLMLCSLLIQYDNMLPLSSLVSNFYTIYQMGGREELGFSSEEEYLSAGVIWEEVISRVYALGALAIFFERFLAVPVLVAKSWPKENRTEINNYRFWAKHALTKLRREQRLQKSSLCVLAAEKVKQNNWFFRKFKDNQELFLNSICQFDFLHNMYCLSIGQTEEDIFPNFGIYSKYMTEPIVLDLILKGKSRASIPAMSDHELANMIQSLDQLASVQFHNFAGWSLNNWTSKIYEFIEKNYQG